jgi:nicotinate-nucleotide pyrophosphorylase (carboxylating)
VIAGLDVAQCAFKLTDPNTHFEFLVDDGAVVGAGHTLARLRGLARGMLSAERVALNFLCHMSGIATATHQFVEAIKPHKTKICCTRKTTPGLRMIEKYAVRAGGGSNHRFGLDDAILIKDNHLAVAGSVREALRRATEHRGHLVKIELEVDTLEQLDEALTLLPTHPIDAVLLDNMDVDTLRKAVGKVAGRLTTEASGGISLANIAAIAATGVDVISTGAITHSAPILDIGLD